jgi:hypothetical protein
MSAESMETEEKGEGTYWKIPLYIIGTAFLLLLIGTALVKLSPSGSVGALLKDSWPIQ